MPAKTKAASDKKKKKSKKELEQERLLLEEQRRREEEAARLAELQRQRERELQLQKLREELDALLEQEEPIFIAQREVLQLLANTQAQQLHSMHDKQEKQLAWNVYLGCSRLPDLHSESDISSYFQMFGELNLVHDEPSFELLEKYLPEITELFSEFETSLSKALDRNNTKEIARLKECMIQFSQIVRNKWDAVTAMLLQHTDHFPREPTENFLLSHQWDILYNFSLWCNFTKNPRHKLVDLKKTLAIAITLPKPITLVGVAIRIMYERSASTLLTYMLRQQTAPRVAPTDGILFLDLMDLPDAAKIIDSWTMRPMLSPIMKITPIAYPFTKTDPEMYEESGEEKESGEEQWSMLVEYKISPGLFLHPQATVCWWSSTDFAWQTTGLNLINRIVKGIVKFKTIHFKPTAVVQSMYTEFPFADWFVEPTMQGTLRFMLRGKLIDLELEVSDKGVLLIRPMTEVLEKDFKGIWMNPSLMLLRLSRFGLNFLAPDASQVTFVDGISMKIDDAEHECLHAISILAHVIRFQRSPLNQKASSCRCLFEAVMPEIDHATPGPGIVVVLDAECKIIEKSRRIAFTHEVQQQDIALVQGSTDVEAVTLTKTSKHKATVYEILKSCWPDKELLMQSDAHVQCSETIYQLLRLMRVFSCS